MRAGDLRTLVRIERPLRGTPDADGFRESAWELVAEVWSDIFGLAGSQIERGPMIDAETSHRIEIRYLDGLAPKMRVVNGDEVYNVSSVIDPDRRRVRLFLFCSRRLQP